MPTWLYFLLPFLGGLAGGAQAPINADLGRRVGPPMATLVSFAVGTAIAVLLVLFVGKGQPGRLASAPWWNFAGGLLGLAFVYSVILSVPRLGAGAAVFAAIVGQTAFSLSADHFGLFGLTRIPLGSLRLAGLALMLAGAGLIAITHR